MASEIRDYLGGFDNADAAIASAAENEVSPAAVPIPPVVTRTVPKAKEFCSFCGKRGMDRAINVRRDPGERYFLLCRDCCGMVLDATAVRGWLDS